MVSSAQGFGGAGISFNGSMSGKMGDDRSSANQPLRIDKDVFAYSGLQTGLI